MRIISLVPSITETLFDFGLNPDQIVGRTKFCIHPEEKIKSVEMIGGTKNLNIEKIKALKPDIIIGNKEENTKEQVEILMKEFKVWITDIQNLEDNRNFISELGYILQQQTVAEKINYETEEIFSEFEIENRRKAAYLIWKNPYMTVGSDTFIHDIMKKLGFENIFRNQLRYPPITHDDLRNTEYILLSSEPFPFREKHAEELKKILPETKIILVDGEAFSWFGSRPSKSGAYYRSLLESL